MASWIVRRKPGSETDNVDRGSANTATVSVAFSGSLVDVGDAMMGCVESSVGSSSTSRVDVCGGGTPVSVPRSIIASSSSPANPAIPFEETDKNSSDGGADVCIPVGRGGVVWIPGAGDMGRLGLACVSAVGSNGRITSVSCNVRIAPAAVEAGANEAPSNTAFAGEDFTCDICQPTHAKATPVTSTTTKIKPHQRRGFDPSVAGSPFVAAGPTSSLQKSCGHFVFSSLITSRQTPKVPATGIGPRDLPLSALCSSA